MHQGEERQFTMLQDQITDFRKKLANNKVNPFIYSMQSSIIKS